MPFVPDDRLHLLEAKEAAHDDYLEALHRVRGAFSRLVQARGYDEFAGGYYAALSDLAEAVVRIVAERLDNEIGAPDVHS
jgi:hypothetical protein